MLELKRFCLLILLLAFVVMPSTSGDTIDETTQTLDKVDNFWERAEKFWKKHIKKEPEESEQTGSETLSHSVTSAEVAQIKEIQQRLTNLGLNPGPIDGVAGSRTQKAIIGFQKIRGLTPTGKVSPKLLTELRKLDQTPHQPATGAGAATLPSAQYPTPAWPPTLPTGSVVVDSSGGGSSDPPVTTHVPGTYPSESSPVGNGAVFPGTQPSPPLTTDPYVQVSSQPAPGSASEAGKPVINLSSQTLRPGEPVTVEVWVSLPNIRSV